jgi:polyketide synthase PksN
MTGLTLRLLENQPEAQTALLRPRWRTRQASQVPASVHGTRWVVLCGSLRRYQAELEAALPGVRCLGLEGGKQAHADRYQAAVTTMIKTLREQIQDHPRDSVLIQVLTMLDGEQALFEGLSGVLRTARLEHSKLLGQMIGVETAESATTLVTQLEACARSPEDREIRYQGGKRRVMEWESMPATQQPRPPWEYGGVYLITGGAGGLGLIFAREIAKQVKAPVLVLTGRSELNESQQTALQALEAQGACVTYQQVDVTDRVAVSALVSDLLEVYGGLNGVLHSAGVIQDSLLANKRVEEIEAVLGAKVAGAMALDEATQHVALEFLILFGSTTGTLGNVGQADYAAGNAFLDAYASWRNQQVALGERQGRTLTIDWPLWRDGGMGVDEGTRQALRALGMTPLESEAGIQALYAAWASTEDRVLVVSGDVKRFQESLLKEAAKTPQAVVESASPIPSFSETSSDDLLDKAEAALVEAVSKQAKLNAGEINLATDLSEYGFDSIMFTQFTRDLNQRYGFELRPTIVFEYPTLRGLAKHLVATYGDILRRRLTPSLEAFAGAVNSANVTSKERLNPHASIAAARQVRRSAKATALQGVSDPAEPVAVIGMSGCFPMAADLEAFWKNLSEGRDCISEIPKARWDWRDFYGDPITEPGKTNIKHGGFIDGVDEFDPLFFGISPREAETMDPQQRLLMTHVWKALEEAGYAADSLAGSQTAVFAGMGGGEYNLLLGKKKIAMGGYSMTGMLPSVGPNRLSYLFNFTGPSEPVETACSSALVAIHRALRVLAEGTSELAIAAGVNTLLAPEYFMGFNSARMLSPDGRCKTFSKDADGYARGEGVGVLVLKRLSEAQAAGDHIHGVIRSSAVNHGGRVQSLTVPNPQAQTAVLLTAYRQAGIDPRTVNYIEAHGTGTPLGDPVEIDGLKQAFATLSKDGDPLDSHYCALGSVKSNIGHLELASAMPSVIKVLLQLRHKTLVKSLHSEVLNPQIQLEESPFYVVKEKRPWEALKDRNGTDLPRRASVNSFGFGGVNAHVVIEEYIEPAREPLPASQVLVVLSAKSKAQLRERVARLLEAIEHGPLDDADLVDMAYTLQVGREAMAFRLGFLAESMVEVKQKLGAYLADEFSAGNLYHSEQRHNKEAMDLFSADEDLAQAIESWVAKGKYRKLLELWVTGLRFDWNQLYGTEKPRRISLPTYPFARERYATWQWEAALCATDKQTAMLHPLVHENRSHLAEHCYVSRFHGSEPFLVGGVDDATDSGQKELPPLLALEMILAAANLAVPQRTELDQWVLRTTAWGAPVWVSGECCLTLTLFAQEAALVGVEISGSEGDEEIVHCQSHVSFTSIPIPGQVDIPALIAPMHKQADGLPQGVIAFYQGQQQTLAEVRLLADQNRDDYLLPPDLFKHLSWLLERSLRKPVIPCSLKRLCRFSNTPERLFFWMRIESPETVSVDLCDEQGNLFVQLEQLRLSVLRNSSSDLSMVPNADFVTNSSSSTTVSHLSPSQPREIMLAPLTESVPQFETVINKPSGIALLPAAEVSLNPLPKKGIVKLPPLWAASSPIAIEPVRLFDLGTGLFAIETDAPSLDTAIRPICQALKAARREEALKVLLLISHHPGFWQGDRQVCNEAITQRLFSHVATFPYPVVAAVPKGASGAGLLLAAVCDVMVCGEEGEYGFTNLSEGLMPSAAEQRLFQQRLGQVLADNLLYQSLRYPGRQLAEKGWSCRVVPSVRVRHEAKALAADLAQKSQLALSLLKIHLGSECAGLVDALLPVAPIQPDRQDSAADPREGVLVVRLGEESKDADPQRVIGELREALKCVSDAKQYRAILVTSAWEGFLPEPPEGSDPAEILALKDLLQSMPLPVIAGFESDAKGLAWLFGLFCDAMVYRRDGHYCASTLWTEPQLVREVTEYCSQRLGSVLGQEVCLSQTSYAGSDLQSRLGALVVVEASQVMTQALDLARFWVAWPRAVAENWKQEQVDQLRADVKALPELVHSKEQRNHEPLPATPMLIPLRSTVVSATAYPEGIVSLVMQEREARNMFSEALMDGLNEAFCLIEQNPAYKVVVLSGYDSYFSSGGTRETLLAIQQGQLKFTDDKVYQLPLVCALPVISAIQGHAIGGGWSLGMFADLVLLSEESRYLSPYMGYGFTPGAGATLVFPHKIGHDLARETLLSAQEISGRALNARGVPLTVLPRQKVVPSAMALAKRLARQSRSRLLDLKQLWAHALRGSTESTYRHEEQMHEQTFVNNTQTLEMIQARFDGEKPGEMRPNQTSSRDEAVASAASIIDTLRMLLAQELFLKPDDIDDETPFIELGLDSITGVNWVSKINDHYKIDLEATKIYSHPTLTQISALVREQAVLITTSDSEPSRPKTAQIALQTATPPPVSSCSLLDTLKTLLAQELFLKPDDIDDETPFIELGLDSITGVNWISKINDHYKIDLEATKIYSHPTLTQIGALVEELAALTTSDLEPSRPRTVPMVPQTAAPPPTGSSSILNKLRTLLAQELFLSAEDIDDETPFIELGLDSITGVNWVSKINQHYATHIEATKIYSHPTLVRISHLVREEMGAALSDQAPTRQVTPSIEKRPPSTVQSALVSWRHKGRGYRSVLPKEEVPLFVPPTAESSIPKDRTSDSLRPIAVIGVAGAFPRASNIDAFWENLAAGRDCISEIPSQRWRLDDYYQEGTPQAGKTNCKYSGLLEEYDHFDPLFFNISPTEAERMDPQQRLFLQSCWHCIENAGYNPQTLSGSQCGVFVGCVANDDQWCPPEDVLSAQGFMGRANSILAGRVSYFLNLHGPSLAIETACSSSLVALAHACDSLNAGNCDSALAGGVYVMGGPAMHIMTSQAGMLSSDGRCFTFDQRANGFVPGEGVGVVLLKRLEDAERDGDRIMGVMEGWGVNQDGKSNGITAPNQTAQSRLIGSVYQKFAIDPAAIELIEAHGTGTKLGDPIEVAGLKEAFGDVTSRSHYCALGSVKSNIGHCMTAAGIAGFIKLILALKHKSLPPTVHFERCNEHIDLAGSPFYINDTLRSWDVAPEQSRRAAVSSFGFSGTNAHIVLAEHRAKLPATRESTHSYPAGKTIVLLSARTPQQLQRKARELLAYIRQHEASLDLVALAYTLQVGRQPMEARLGLLVDSLQTLLLRLKAYLDGDQGIEDLHQGQVAGHHEAIKLLSQDQEMGGMLIEKYLSQQNLSKLLDLWVKGVDLDWALLYSKAKPQPIELPLYPFEKERYWTQRRVVNMEPTALVSVGRLHPLLHRNTSNLRGQRYSSTFSGDESLMGDHVVGGRKILPGVAYLELVRAAVEHSVEVGTHERMRLEDVTWLKPLVVDEVALEVHIGLYSEDDGAIGYEIYEGREDQPTHQALNSQGRVVLEDLGEPPVIDLKTLQGYCCERERAQEAFYSAVKEGGLVHYGPAYRGVEQIAIGRNASGLPEVLASLRLPLCVTDTQDSHLLHPSFMDAAVQAVGVLAQEEGSGKIAVPFTVDGVRIWSGTPLQGWAWVRYSTGSSPKDKIGRFDIDLFDQSGRVCVGITGLALRTLESRSKAETTLLRPRWRVQEVSETHTPSYAARWVVLCGAWQQHGMAIESAIAEVNCLRLASDQEDNAARYQTAVIRTIDCVVELMEKKPKEPVLIQVVTGLEDEGVLFEGLSGVLHTAQLENPKLLGQVIGVEIGEHASELIKKLEQSAQTPGDRRIRYPKSEPRVLTWEKISPSSAQPLWRDRGIYLITGGAGGLGQIFAREIAQQVERPVLVLSGRSRLNEEKQALLQALEELGAQVDYQCVDVTEASAVAKLVDELTARYGGVNGVLHCAGVTHDSLMQNKRPEEILTVLGPKVAGVVSLDQATQNLDLEFMILFASTAGVLGNLGQADYAAGNAFLDAYASWRNERVSKGERGGRTLSVAWPLWRDGGMQVDESTIQALRAESMVPLTSEAGIQALYEAWASEEDQVWVVSGNAKQLLENQTASKPIVTPKSLQGIPETALSSDLLEKVQAALIQAVSKQTRVSSEQVNTEKELSEYGFDSIMFTQFTRDLNQRYGLDLSPAIVFEYPTLKDLAQHLASAYETVLAERFASSSTAAVPAVDHAMDHPLATKARQPRSYRQLAHHHPAPPDSEEGIAVIGMSGCFPMAEDLEAFWHNLSEGKHCISEIPKERWDWRECYGDPMTQPGKTNVKYGGFINGVDKFDPRFFGVSPQEAEIMDPQQRLLMTYVWKALEDAGYAAGTLAGSQTAIFAGMGGGEYSLIMKQAGIEMSGYSMTGMVPSVGPNRLSYLFDFHGPSEPVETACSSSLVAIHRAMKLLRDGECELAIAGGVNTLMALEGYLGFSSAGMLCKDGRCKTFSKEANGYVRGEGVGILVLKKLSAAEAAGDQIYGVIRGSAQNHGGRAQSLTAPNPKAQAEVLQAAYRKAGIDPRTVSYIEAHGTGTALGDPVEVNGLKQAFAALTRDGEPLDSGYCGLGSVKTNIGHLELAAGVAGVIKVLLQLRHKTLVKSLHCEEINPYIQLRDSPFYIVRERQPWEVLKDSDGRDLPRRAGVSSFGFGGVNAHVVIEEYRRPARESVRVSPALVVLSAKNEIQLRERVSQLLRAIASRSLGDADLADMAYTLQIGREPMEVRIGFLADGMVDVISKLEAYLADKEGIEDLYSGALKRDRELATLVADEDMAQAIEAWLDKGKYSKLLELWVKGASFDWNRLYRGAKPHRITLPSYPFAQERYWVNEHTSMAQQAALIGERQLHPLLHRNTSNLWGQRFSSTFHGDEHFLVDHQVAGRKILPGAAYLELAQAAVRHSAGNGATGGISLEDVVWLRPLAFESVSMTLHIGLYPEDDGSIGYEIYDGIKDEHQEPLIHSQGKVVLEATGASPSIDLEAIQTRCCKQELSAERLYALFDNNKLTYGPAHRAIEHLAIGMGATGQPEVLAKLTLPESVIATQSAYRLHPSMMDAALQAVAGVSLETSGKTYLPFAVDKVQIWADTPQQGWAWVRYSTGLGSGNAVAKFDIDISDQSGQVCVRLTGFSARALTHEDKAQTVLFQPQWRIQAAVETNTLPRDGTRWIVLCEPLQGYQGELETALPGVYCRGLGGGEADLANRYQVAVTGLIDALGELFRNKPSEPVLIQVAVALNHDSGLFEGLSGVLRSAQLENPRVQGQVIGFEALENVSDLVAKLQESAHTKERAIRYRQGERLVLEWNEIPDTALQQADSQTLWHDGGIYLITGGVGGLGLIFAHEVARRVSHPVLVLTGRSELDEPRRASLQALETLGARVTYRRVDVTDSSAVSALVAELVAHYGALHGIVHSAGVIRDSLLINKAPEEVGAVLAPKLAGVIALDQATQDVDLEFLILFSSGAGVLGNVGQADYAAGNAFMDAFASWRNHQVMQGERQGRTLSIDWPPWQSGGMAVDEAVVRALSAQGIAPLASEAGVQALYDAWSGDVEQVLVLSGDVARLRSKLGTGADKRPDRSPESTTLNTLSVPQSDLLEKVQEVLVQAVSKQLKVLVEEIDLDSELSEYGFDSISFTQFTNDMNLRYELDLRPTVVFEYPTLGELAHFLVEKHSDLLGKQLAPSEQSTATLETIAEEPVKIEAEHPLRHARRALNRPVRCGKQTENGDAEPIAVIGMSGHFPMARDIEAFWHNLSEGRECICEIPKTRWDWRAVYGNPLTEPGKTNIKHGGFIDGVDEFDPLFFGISPREAETMDPQQRLLMTHVWKALEDAGYAVTDLSGSATAIFAGTGGSEYSTIFAKAGIELDSYAMTGMVPSVGPNRLSHLFNFHGPSEPIETACSSSLVAIHRALQVLMNGECELAIAGGVNTLLTADAFVGFSNAGMLSEDGRCKTFSKEANGYVRGEGIGILILKRLSAAEAAGDHIHGVIRGSAENHGGRAQSLTAPNPKAQAEVLKAAYRKAGVDPRTVSYIEAHGTGTALGDPIEIDGLKQAFAALSEDGDPLGSAYCGLGSVKTNIGHLELAAGVAGVIKVLLQLRHKTLVKSLHSEVINPYIELEESPFYVVRERCPWKTLTDGAGEELPRRAGVSSFGFGGVNAHVVLEEYVEPAPRAVSVSVALVVLSAKNKKRLRAQAQQLLNLIESRPLGDAELADMAYTLQVGRVAMESRLGLLASNMDEVKRKLKAYLADQREIEALYRGEVKRNQETVGLFSADEDMVRAIEAWVTKGKYSKLLDLWVKGLSFDWNRLYPKTKPRRIGLPTYPFVKERYWITGSTGKETSVRTQNALLPHVHWLHPLLHRNTSNLWGQRFSSVFSGDECFLSDHIVGGRRMLPGVAWLELARAAVAHATDGFEGMRLVDVMWLRPLVLEGSELAVHIALYPEDDGAVGYEITNGADDKRGGPVIYGQGRVVLASSGQRPALDLEAIQARCHDHTLSGEALYARFQSSGFDYGPAHRGLERLLIGHDEMGRSEVLARLRLPQSVVATQDSYTLHPSLMDAALQAVAGLVLDEEFTKAHVPFAVDEVRFWSDTPRQGWSWVRYSAENKIDRFDIDLCDDLGQVCVRLRGFTVRALEGGVAHPAKVEDLADSKNKLLLLAPVWDAVTVAQDQSTHSAEDRTLVMGGTKLQREALCEHLPKAVLLDLVAETGMDSLKQRLEALGEIDRILWIAPETPVASLSDDLLIKAQEQGVLQCFHLFKALVTLGYEHKPLSWTLMTTQALAIDQGDTVFPAHAGVHGFAGSLAKEYPHWQVHWVDLPAEEDWPLEALLCLPIDPKGAGWCFRNAEWYRRCLLPGTLPVVEQTRYREGGVYVVIGGAGGIGEVWSEYMIRRYGARIVWVGRRNLDEVIEAKQTRLSQLGPRPHYLSADAGDRRAMEAVHATIRERYGEVHGVIHSAIVLEDANLLLMSEQRFRAVLEAKVNVSVVLAQVFADEPLDFVLFFSSMQSFITAPGQSNYAAGCTFKDAFSQALDRAWSCPVKTMNWGYWGHVGVVATQAYRNRMSALGIASIEAEEGMAALELLLNSDRSQWGLLKSNRPDGQGRVVRDERLFIQKPKRDLVVENLSSYKAIPPEEQMRLRHEEHKTILRQRFWDQLREMGLSASHEADFETIKERLGIVDRYDHWLAASLALGVAQGQLQGHKGRYRLTSGAQRDTEAQWERYQAAWDQDPIMKARLQREARALAALPAILRGEIQAKDVLLSDNTTQQSAGSCKNNIVADYFDQGVANLVEALVQAQDEGSHFRILEIGAGSGGSTSARVFACLAPYPSQIAEYCYTDLSQTLLEQLKQRHAQLPYLETRLLDIEQPLGEQGMVMGRYDLVIASQVLHTTHNIRQSLRNAKAALRHHGLLLLNEPIEASLSWHLTFGLLEDEGYYQDAPLRFPGTPQLSLERWIRVLEAEGFSQVLPPLAASQGLGQQIIVAQSDGVVRQPWPSHKKLSLVTERQDREKPTQLSAPPDDREELLSKVQEELIRVVSEQLKVRVEEIDLESELNEYGFDSISFTQFASDLNHRYQLDLLPTVGFEYPTLGSLAHHLVQAYRDTLLSYFALPGTVKVTTQQPAPKVRPFNRRRISEPRILADKTGKTDQTATLCWFPLRKPKDSAKIKLFCFPYAIAGGASLFYRWQELFAEEVEVCPVQLPGRENRIKEQPFNDLDRCVDVLCEVISPELDRPYALYGHSGGGLIAYRLAFKLHQIHGREAQHLFIGAYPSPSICPNPIVERIRKRFADAGVTTLPDLLNASESEQRRYSDVMTSVLAPLHIEGELGKELLPLIIADTDLMQSYTWDETRIDLPVTVFHGVEDEVVTEQEMMAWQVHTDGPFSFNRVAGDHLFIREQESQRLVVKLIEQKLLGLTIKR